MAAMTTEQASLPPEDDAHAIVPAGRLWRFRRAVRYRLTRGVLRLIMRACLRFRAEGMERLPVRPYVLCFNHLNWLDPLVILVLWPTRPRVYFFGQAEQDMRVGGRNRMMSWLGTAVPYNPGKTNLLASTRKVGRVLAAGNLLAIAGEGRLSEEETVVLPLNEGPAFFALRNQVPLVPVAINGTRWLRIGKRIRVRVVEPIETAGRRASREEVEALTARAHQSLSSMVADYRDEEPPGRFGRWLTDVFNERPWRARRAATAGAEPGPDAGGTSPPGEPPGEPPAGDPVR